jgi:hypothetical protein
LEENQVADDARIPVSVAAKQRSRLAYLCSFEKSFLNVGCTPNFVGRFVSVPTPAIRGVAEKCLNGLEEDIRCILQRLAGGLCRCKLSGFT